MTVTAAILAGGLGSRIGGDKAMVELAGHPLISYPLEAASAAGLNAVVVAKRSTRLPPLEVRVIIEPDEPNHPLLGIVAALEQLPAIIAIPCDMPFVAPSDLRALAASAVEVAILAAGQPLPALYRRAMLPQLRAALDAGASVRSTQGQALLAPASTAAINPATLTAINTPEDLARAEALLRSR